MQFSPRAVSASSLAADNDSPSPKSPIKSIEARPNNNLALNDTYIEQSDPVEVLKDWKVRLTANPSTTTSTYHWEKKEDKDSDWSSIGDGQTVEWEDRKSVV